MRFTGKCVIVALSYWICCSLLVPFSIADDSDSFKQKALNWVEAYRKVQVLFNDKDIEALHDRLAAANEDEAKQWWNKTASAREALDSERWQKTRDWLKQFLRVQAIYSDKEVEEFRDETSAATKLSPDNLKQVLSELENFRTSWTSGVANAPKLREREQQVINAYKKETFAARESARRQAAARAATAANTGTNPVPRREYHRPPALIDSLDVARRSVLRGFWGPW